MTQSTIINGWPSLLLLVGELTGARDDIVVHRLAQEVKDRAQRKGFLWGDDWAPAIPSRRDLVVLAAIITVEAANEIHFT